MFTGLVEKTGTVISVSEKTSELSTLIVDAGPSFERVHGASIAVNGVCLTETGDGNSGSPLVFHVSHETLAKSSLGDLKPNFKVNLERAMRPSDRLGGHIMLGHVDTTGVVSLVRPEAKFVYLEVTIPVEFSKYVVSKGSIAIDGVSLTVNALRDTNLGCVLSLMLIPVTWSTTRFADAAIGDRVNIEVDIIAKHLERLAMPWKKN